MIIFLLWVAFAVVTSLAAASRGRSAGGWFCIGFLFSIFGLIAVLVMKPLDRDSGRAS